MINQLSTVMSRRQNGSVLVALSCAQFECVVSCRQTLYRGEAHRQDRVHLRVPLHRVWYLRQKVRAVPVFLCGSLELCFLDAPLRPLQSLIFLRIWNPQSPTDTPPILSSSTVSPPLDQARSSALSGLMVLERVLLSKYSRGSSNRTLAVMM